MAKKKITKPVNVPTGTSLTSSSVDELLMAALERGGDTLETGRYLVTFKENSGEEGISSLGSVHGMRVADARDFSDQATVMEELGDSDAVVFPEIGVEYELEAIGQITGEASDAVQKAAQKIKGITSISPSGDDINIGNPDSDITW